MHGSIYVRVCTIYVNVRIILCMNANSYISYVSPKAYIRKGLKSTYVQNHVSYYIFRNEMKRIHFPSTQRLGLEKRQRGKLPLFIIQVPGVISIAGIGEGSANLLVAHNGIRNLGDNEHTYFIKRSVGLVSRERKGKDARACTAMSLMLIQGDYW